VAGAKDTIYGLEVDKVSLLQENTNLTDQLRLLMIECRMQEQDLNLSRKSVVCFNCTSLLRSPRISENEKALIISL